MNASNNLPNMIHDDLITSLQHRCEDTFAILHTTEGNWLFLRPKGKPLVVGQFYLVIDNKIWTEKDCPYSLIVRGISHGNRHGFTVFTLAPESQKIIYSSCKNEYGFPSVKLMKCRATLLTGGDTLSRPSCCFSSSWNGQQCAAYISTHVDQIMSVQMELNDVLCRKNAAHESTANEAFI